MRFFIGISLSGALLAGGLFSCTETTPVVENNEPVSIDSLLLKYPDSVGLLIERGNAYIDAYAYDKAMSDAAKAFRLDSNNMDARALYAAALNNRQNRSIEDVFKAQRHYHLLHEKAPKNTAYLVGLASTYSQLQDFDRSFQYINDALRIDPKYRDAYVLKGSNYSALGNEKLKISSYETAIQQDPTFFAGYVMLGAIYQEQGNPVCIEYYATALELEPNNKEAEYAVAYAKQHFGQEQEAKEIYRAMMKDSSEYFSSQALFQMGHMKQFLENDIDSAIYFYEGATLVEQQFVEAYHNLGVCYDLKGNKEKALKSFGKALKINPEFALSRQYADSIQYK